MHQIFSKPILISAFVISMSGCTSPSVEPDAAFATFRSVDVAGLSISLADTRFSKDGKNVSCQQHIDNVNTVPSPEGTITSIHSYHECQIK